MIKEIECPVCDGSTNLVFRNETKTFRKEKFKIFAHFYKCSKCNEEFSTTETDDVNIKQVFNQYRECHNILLPGQMKFIREQYGLSAAKMALVLGLGTNQYGLYEKGDMPNESNSQFIDVISKPVVFKDHLIKRKSLFTTNEFNKTLLLVDSLIMKEGEKLFCHEKMYFDPLESANEMNGYQMQSLLKFGNMVVYFLKSAFTVTRLNKFLFYADFLNFKNTGVSITGCNYAAIPLGPVPNGYKTIFDLLEGRGFIATEPYYTGYEVYEKFIPGVDFNEALFSKEELDTLKTVESNLSKLNTDKVIDLSHEEIGWLSNKDRMGLISYQKYGFLLKTFS